MNGMYTQHCAVGDWQIGSCLTLRAEDDACETITVHTVFSLVLKNQKTFLVHGLSFIFYQADAMTSKVPCKARNVSLSKAHSQAALPYRSHVADGEPSQGCMRQGHRCRGASCSLRKVWAAWSDQMQMTKSVAFQKCEKLLFLDTVLSRLLNISST